ncbi:hypothetical protein D3C80_1816700 [compost metagenome]
MDPANAITPLYWKLFGSDLVIELLFLFSQSACNIVTAPALEPESMIMDVSIPISFAFAIRYAVAS